MHHTTITLSGGTFHTVNMGPNTGGTLATNSILSGGTDWSWGSTLPATLATSPGPGVVTFAPDSTHTITLTAAFSGPGALTANGPGTLAMGGANTYPGITTVNQGTLALLGTGSISNSADIIVAGGAELDASGLSSNMILSAGQILTNSGSPALLKGNIDTGSGKLGLLYNTGTPSFTVVGGTVGMATNTTVVVNNTGTTFNPGSYRLVSATSGGLVSGAGLPPVTVIGGGVVGGQFVSLTVSGGELYLVVTNDRPPAIANDLTQSVSSGASWQIAITNLASLAGEWSDPDGDAVSLSSVGPQSADPRNQRDERRHLHLLQRCDWRQ